jgi:hypothetical protein
MSDVRSLPKSPPQLPAEEDLGRVREAAWIIDLDSARVVAANPAGNAFQNGVLRQGTYLDKAMPALQELREIAEGAPSEGLRRLLIWSADGPINLHCTCRRLGGEGCRVLVRSAESPASWGADQGALAAGPTRALVAHELRTPLSAIVALAEVMKEEHLGPMGNPRYLTYANDIYQSANHALSVLAAMLGEQQESSAPQEPSRTAVDEVVSRALAIMGELARKASVRIRCELASGAHLAIDHRDLMQILINLLSNALKFTGPGGEVTISTAREPDGGLTLTVADTGCGMRSDAPRAGEVAKGAGYGLPVVMALAQANGATVDFASAPGEGTRVIITFPADRVSGPDAAMA